MRAPAMDQYLDPAVIEISRVASCDRVAMFLTCSCDHGIPVWSAVRDMHSGAQNRRGAPERQYL